MDDLIKEAVALLATSARLSVFSGSGMSQASGLPTFRESEDGLWMNEDPDDVASAWGLYRNPQRVRDFFQSYRARIRAAEPNAGHRALAAFERYLNRFPIITQNIDDLHERAGSQQVIHLHGQIFQNRCSRYCQGVPTLVSIDDTGREIPTCPFCGAMVRPDVILFGEYLHSTPIEQAQDIARQTDVMLITGTSGLVAPASKLPLLAQDSGAALIEINPQPSRVTPNVDPYIPMPAAEALTQMLHLLHEYWQ